MSQPLTNLVLQKLHLNLPSFSGQLLNAEYSNESNLSDVLRSCNTMPSFNYKPKASNVYKLNILSVGASTVIKKNITENGHDLLIVVPTLTLTIHSTASLEHGSYGTQSLISELRFNPVEIELSASDTDIKPLKEKVIQNTINDPKFKNLLKGWHVHTLLIHDCPHANISLSIGFGQELVVGHVQKCIDQCSFLEKLSGKTLWVRNEEAIRKEMVTASPSRSTVNLVVTRELGERIAYLGDRATPSSIHPFHINIAFDSAQQSELFNMFLSQHFLSVTATVAVDTDISIPKSEFNRIIIKSQNEIEDVYMSGLDDF